MYCFHIYPFSCSEKVPVFINSIKVFVKNFLEYVIVFLINFVGIADFWVAIEVS